MSTTSLLYVSTSTLPPGTAGVEVDRIVEKAQRNNVLLNLTGALLFTGTHFAQVLEGDDADIDILLKVVMDDPRHRDVMIVDRSTVAARRFPDWRMAYSGPSKFVAKFVSRLLQSSTETEHDRASAWLKDLMREFSKA